MSYLYLRVPQGGPYYSSSVSSPASVPSPSDKVFLLDARSLDSRETVLDKSHLPFKNPGMCSISRRLAHLVREGHA
jgi:hypothetical protein